MTGNVIDIRDVLGKQASSVPVQLYRPGQFVVRRDKPNDPYYRVVSATLVNDQYRYVVTVPGTGIRSIFAEDELAPYEPPGPRAA